VREEFRTGGNHALLCRPINDTSNLIRADDPPGTARRRPRIAPANSLVDALSARVTNRINPPAMPYSTTTTQV